MCIHTLTVYAPHAYHIINAKSIFLFGETLQKLNTAYLHNGMKLSEMRQEILHLAIPNAILSQFDFRQSLVMAEMNTFIFL